MVPYNIFLSKLERNGFGGWTAWWLRNWLDGGIQRVNSSVDISDKWGPSGVCVINWVSPFLLKLFIDYIDKEIKCMLSKFTGDSKDRLPSQGIWTSSGSEPTQISWYSTRPNAKCHTWAVAIPSTNICLGDGQQLCQEGVGDDGEWDTEHDQQCATKIPEISWVLTTNNFDLLTFSY